jgi:hypothetical protein
MIQIGAFTILIMAMFLKTEAVSLFLPQGFLYGQNNPWSRHIYMYPDPNLDYGSEVNVDTFPGEKFISYDQMQPYVNMPLQKDRAAPPLAAKRAFNGLPTIAKRIHTCAFMRRLGLPIGLCFKGSRSRVSQQPAVEEADSPEQDAYDYLQTQWPVQSMFGGAVGK